MEVAVKVTVDLGDRTMALLGGFMSANKAVADAADTVDKVLGKYAEEPEPEAEPAEQPARSRRSRRAAEDAPTRPRPRRRAAEPEDEADEARPEPAKETAPEEETPWARRNRERGDDTRKAPSRNPDDIRDDIRECMAAAIEADGENKQRLRDRLTDLGAKSPGTLADEHLEGFLEFAQSLKRA